MRVVAFGSRKARDREPVWVALDAIRAILRGHGHEIELLLDGAAPGIDSLAHYWAKARGIETLRFPADWSQGPGAGPKRNQMLVAQGRPDIGIMFPGGEGTADMHERLEAAGVEIIRVRRLRAGTYFRQAADEPNPRLL